MKKILLGFGLLLVFGGAAAWIYLKPTLHVQVTPEAETPAEVDEPMGDERCAAAPGKPVLDAKAYTDYRSEFKPDLNQNEETVGLDRDTQLKVASGGCETYNRVVRLLVTSFKVPPENLEYWAKFLADRVKGLKLSDSEAKGDFDQIVAFLGKAAALKLRKPGEVMECVDGSAPTEDGCAWNTRGTLRLKVDLVGHAVRVEMVHQQAL